MCLSFLFTFRLSPNCGTIFILCSSPYKWKLFWKIWCFWFSEIKDCDTNQLDGEHHQHPYPSLPERRRSKQERRWSWGRGPHGKWNILKELLTANLKVQIIVLKKIACTSIMKLSILVLWHACKTLRFQPYLEITISFESQFPKNK